MSAAEGGVDPLGGGGEPQEAGGCGPAPPRRAERGGAQGPPVGPPPRRAERGGAPLKIWRGPKAPAQRAPAPKGGGRSPPRGSAQLAPAEGRGMAQRTARRLAPARARARRRLRKGGEGARPSQCDGRALPCSRWRAVNLMPPLAPRVAGARFAGAGECSLGPALGEGPSGGGAPYGAPPPPRTS